MLRPALSPDDNSSAAAKSTNRQLVRNRRYAMRAASSRFGGWSVEHVYDGDWSQLPWRAAAGCSKSSLLEDGTVAVRCGESADGSPRAYFAGLRRCGSVWLCPVCTATIRSHRAEEVNQIAAAHAAAGGSVSMLTLTVRHRASTDLDELYPALRGAWKSLQQSAHWRRIRSEMVGQTVTVEATLGDNGWHVHLHVLLLWEGTVERHVQAHRLASLRAWGCRAWAERVERKLGLRPSDERGFHVIDIAADAATYVAKIAAEVTRGDYKSKDALEVMLDGVADGDARLCARFVEWASFMPGKRMIRFSPGLRALYIPDEPELTDEEVVNLDPGSPVIGQLSGDDYRSLLSTSFVDRVPAAARFLTEIENTGTHELLRPATEVVPIDRSNLAVRVHHKRGLGYCDQGDEVAGKLQERWQRSDAVRQLLTT